MMIDFFSYLYPDNSVNKKGILYSLRIYSILRFLIRIVTNIYIPLYFRITNVFFEFKLSDNTKDDLIVSLTTFPARINKVWLVVESILRQTHKPDKIILWLSEEQFSDITKLPKELLKLQKRGLEIEFCKGDLRSHKKYYYTLQKYPNSDVVTIDDDIFYRSDLIKTLWEVHLKYPGSVKCVRAYGRIIVNNGVVPYRDWQVINVESEPRADIFPTSGAGTLYPAGVFYKDVLRDDLFMQYCSTADDIWLFCMVLMNNRCFVKVDFKHVILPILYRNNFKLSAGNVGRGDNDRQLLRLRDYYIEYEGFDFLGRMSTKESM